MSDGGPRIRLRLALSSLKLCTAVYSLQYAVSSVQCKFHTYSRVTRSKFNRLALLSTVKVVIHLDLA